MGEFEKLLKASDQDVGNLMNMLGKKGKGLRTGNKGPFPEDFVFR